MAKDSGIRMIAMGASAPPVSGGNVDIRKQGFTSNDSYGSETFADRLAEAPHDEELL